MNPIQTVKLYETVRAAAGLTGRETVVDAYCGTGTIGLWLAPYAREVRGIESIPEAVEDAKANAARNGRDNAAFYAGYAEELLPRWVKSGFAPDVIVADRRAPGSLPASSKRCCARSRSASFTSPATLPPWPRTARCCWTAVTPLIGCSRSTCSRRRAMWSALSYCSGRKNG